MRVNNFSLSQTLECGQCFNFEKIAENDYIVVACGKVLHVIQHTPDEVEFVNASGDDVRDIWIPYFDLDRDYDEIKNEVVKADPRLAPVVEKYGGLRILNQEFPETLLSFIISQNKNIPQIKKIIRSICEEYGEYPKGGADFKTFPAPERLSQMTEEDFRNLKTGFRAPYLINAIRAMEGGLSGDALREMTFEEAKKALTGIKGVGDKVANCVLLFSLGFRSAFPVDVWIKRIMEEMYFGKDTDKKVIEEFAADKFGKWGGYAQQYLFMYVREKKS